MSRSRQILEAYGDNPVEVLRNGMLGVARAKKLNKLPKDQKPVQVAALVNSWILALGSNREEIVEWLLKKLSR